LLITFDSLLAAISLGGVGLRRGVVLSEGHSHISFAKFHVASMIE